MRRVLYILLLFNALVLYSQEPENYLLRTAALMDQEKFGRVIETASEGLSEVDDSRLYLIRGEAYLITGEYELAKSDFRSANRLNNGCGEFGLARVYAATGDAVQSVESLVRNMKSSFKISEKELLLDKFLEQVETSVQWKEFIKFEWYTELEKGEASVEYNLANGRIEEAENVVAELESIYSEKPELDFLKGSIELQKGNYKKAVVFFGNAVNGGLDGYKVREEYISALNSNGNYETALVEIEKIEKEYADKPGLLVLKAESLENAGATREALTILSKYMDLYPDSEPTLSRMGRIALKSRDYSSALKYFSRNIDINPGDPNHFIERGNIYLNTRSWSFADKDYSMALDLDPDNGQTWYNKGVALIEMGNTDDACHCFIQSRRLGNKNAASMIGKYCIR